ncbi:DUF6302 family protein [Streptomyces collinus]|uniref:DUF6302 family protein n=1 Tax=Streptomyces collinus TaxID=42684 RepID=UPI0037D45F18
MRTLTARPQDAADVAGPAPAPLTVELRPATEAYDYEYYRNLLADPSVLADSVAVRVHRAPLLAVPAGGPRRGGCLSVTDPRIGDAIRRLLLGRPGFWDLRMALSPREDTCHTLRWGHEPQYDDPAYLGRFYGYCPAAISAFLRNRGAAT